MPLAPEATAHATRRATVMLLTGALVCLATFAACGSSAASSGAAANSAPAGPFLFKVNTASERHQISPYIYGWNEYEGDAKTLGLALQRFGGNRWTAYNWENNASNAGEDYDNQNDALLGGGDVAGEAVRKRVAAAFEAGAAAMVTIPIAGYVAADTGPGGDVNRTPDYLNRRFVPSRAMKPTPPAYPPSTGDGYVFQSEFVAWLESAFPKSSRSPHQAILYSLDNEPDLWAVTHPRIRPNGPVSYDELRRRSIDFATAIKSMAPEALVFGPVSYGWSGYVELQDAPDGGGRDFLDYYLEAMRDAEAHAGHRLLDVLDLHWYPEARGGGVRITKPNASTDVAVARMQAPRSLWDPRYVEDSWIAASLGPGPIRLIPRMKEKIAAHYPGTRLAFTEYSYGGENDISGAIAEADALGIFGREDVLAAAFWPMNDDSSFVEAAFAIYGNYDGHGARFGDTAVQATTSDPVRSSIYASVDAGKDDRVVMVAINKGPGVAHGAIELEHKVALAHGRCWRLVKGSPHLQQGPDVTPSAPNRFQLDLPARSVSVIVLTP
jgi:hypothetical protein